MLMRLCVVLGSLAAALPPLQTRSGLHKDEELGFQMEMPKDWKKVPLAASEQWVVAKYMADRELVAKTELVSHTPEVKVILFPAEVVKDRGVKVEKPKEGEVHLRFKNPYKDYKSYLKDNSYGGYYVSKEEETTVNGLKATCLEIRFEKLTVARRALAWVFKDEVGEWAVHFEALEDWWEKVSPEYARCLRSFKFIPRTRPSAAGAKSADDDFETLFEMKKSPPAERAAKRSELFDRELRTAIERLPSGWIRKKSANFHALSHVDDRYTTRILEQAEAITAWLGQNFSWVGDGIPGPAIVRICKDDDEYRAVAETSRDSFFRRSFELPTYKDVDEGRQSFGVQNFNQGLVELWLHDKNPRLAWGMPPWVQLGISQFLMTASAKGGRLEFKPDEWEKELMREAEQKGRIARPRDLMVSGMQEISKTEHGWAQCGVFMRYLWTGPRSATTRELFKDYMKHFLAVLEEEEKEEEAGMGKKGDKPKTEEEEEARFRQRTQREKKRLEQVFLRAFGSWTEADWAAFDRSYLAFAD